MSRNMPCYKRDTCTTRWHLLAIFAAVRRLWLELRKSLHGAILCYKYLSCNVSCYTTSFSECGVTFTLINAIDVASGDQNDDQGEHTDPSLDFAVPMNTDREPNAAPNVEPTSPPAKEAAQYGEKLPLFYMPTVPAAPTTNIPPTDDLDAAVPILEISQNSLPKSWYVIISGPFEGVCFAAQPRTQVPPVKMLSSTLIAVLTARAQVSLTKRRRPSACAKHANNGFATLANRDRRRR
eukprot:6185339-Pleurochrysis_carterae.AAC.1